MQDEVQSDWQALGLDRDWGNKDLVNCHPPLKTVLYDFLGGACPIQNLPCQTSFILMGWCLRKKHHILLRANSPRCRIGVWLEGRLKETPTWEGKIQIKSKCASNVASLFQSFRILWRSNCWQETFSPWCWPWEWKSTHLAFVQTHSAERDSPLKCRAVRKWKWKLSES